MPDGCIDPRKNYVKDIRQQFSRAWPTIRSAANAADEVRGILSTGLNQYTSEDVDIVLSGSLARREWTSGSDVDWTMLVDAQVDTKHWRDAQDAAKTLAALTYKGTELKSPGREGIFGNLVFSHGIVHHIGGEKDTNRNTTQRILLLLEATSLRDPTDQVGGPLGRITRQVLSRYLQSDSNFHSRTDNSSRIPRFLLNDLVRYWRTMCVDFAYKDWDRAGQGWALRNIKLRTSRKLLFVAGLLMVFSCYDNESLTRDKADNGVYAELLQAHLLRFVEATPLNIVAWTLIGIGRAEKCAKIIDSYEEYLAKIDDKETRNHLEGLSESKVYEDPTFLECRSISQRFHSELTEVCFDVDTPLSKFMIEYGVF